MTRDIVRLTVERLTVDGDGLARRRDEVWFVGGVAPGDVVEVVEEPGTEENAGGKRARGSRKSEVGSRGIRKARLLKVVKASPDRVVPACAHLDECGGCDWLHVSAEARRRAKLELVREALGVPSELPLEFMASPERFRRVARFAVGVGRTGPVIGFRSEQSRRVAALSDCAALEPELSAALGALAHARAALKAWLAAGGEELWALSDATRKVHLADGAPPPAGKKAAPRARQAALEKLRAALPESLRPAAGAVPSTEAGDGGPALAVAAGGFVQANRAVALRLARIVGAAAGAMPGRVVELYAGSGHLTVGLPRLVESIVAVESDAAAAGVLAANLGARPGLRATAVHADAARALRKLERSPDVVVADPPRAGLGDAAKELAKLHPARVVLVSCDLRALARDRKALADAGYVVDRVILADMFPPTHHVEVVTILVRASSAP
jgi:23S rRNA (uracil1939-C5)-methyltransferase